MLDARNRHSSKLKDNLHSRLYTVLYYDFKNESGRRINPPTRLTRSYSRDFSTAAMVISRHERRSNPVYRQ
jgi:hypothetical protein